MRLDADRRYQKLKQQHGQFIPEIAAHGELTIDDPMVHAAATGSESVQVTGRPSRA